jgi:hypothetical protein
MLFRDSLSSLLPAPRDDEPASLRQDIVDELSDHLACAYNRELLRGTNTDLAHQRVLNRFGDPAAVARRLWLDAMKGKIMAQRVLIATCLVVMLACGASVGLAWNWMNQDRLLRSREAAEATEANRRVSEALNQSQVANRELLKQMRDMSDAVLHPVSTDWNPVLFKLTEEAADGPPAAEFSLTLTRMEGPTRGMGAGAVGKARDVMVARSGATTGPRLLRMVLPPAIVAQSATAQFGGMGGMGMGGMGGASAKAIRRISDAAGIADFGAVPPGDYSFQISKNWGSGYFTTAGQLNVLPGRKIEKSIVCPKTPPDRTRVRVHWSWPVDLDKEQLILYAPFTYRYRKLDSELEWVLTDSASRPRQRRRSNQGMMNPGWSVPAVRSVLCGPATALTEVRERARLLFWAFSHLDENGIMTGVPKSPVWADLLTENLREVKLPTETPEPTELAWELGVYGLDQLIVLRPTRPPGVEGGRKRFDVLVGSFFAGSLPSIQLRGEPLGTSIGTGQGGTENRGGPPTQEDLEASTRGFDGPVNAGMGGSNNDGWTGWEQSVPLAKLPSDFWDKVDTAFEVRPGQVNEWTIPVPDELIKAVRAALKDGPTAKAKAALPAAPHGGQG